MSDQLSPFSGCTLNKAWLDSEIRQEVADAIVRLNGAAARWARATPQNYWEAEQEFLKFWIDLEGVMIGFTDTYVPPEPPSPAPWPRPLSA
jgi:hypothetical protein